MPASTGRVLVLLAIGGPVYELSKGTLTQAWMSCGQKLDAVQRVVLAPASDKLSDGAWQG